MKYKFERLPSLSAGGTGLISRRHLNPSLDYAMAFSIKHFRDKLRAHFGEPDKSDDGFSYSILEVKAGVRFEAYAGGSGPKYGGEVDFMDEQNKPHYLRQDIYEMLYAFDVWIENGAS